MAQTKKKISRSQPGIDKEGRQNLDYIKENSEFFEKKDGYQNFGDTDIIRMAVALTIKKNLTLKEHPTAVGKNAGGSAWQKSQLETTPSLTQMVEIMVPQEQREDVWIYIEQAAITGLEYLKECVKKGKTFSEIME
jgi:hypothetical protein